MDSLGAKRIIASDRKQLLRMLVSTFQNLDQAGLIVAFPFGMILFPMHAMP